MNLGSRLYAIFTSCCKKRPANNPANADTQAQPHIVAMTAPQSSPVTMQIASSSYDQKIDSKEASSFLDDDILSSDTGVVNFHFPSEIKAAWNDDEETGTRSFWNRSTPRKLIYSAALITELASMAGTIYLVRTDENLFNAAYYTLTCLLSGMSHQTCMEFIGYKKLKDFNQMIFGVLRTALIALQSVVIDASIPKEYNNDWSVPIAKQLQYTTGAFVSGVVLIETASELIDYFRNKKYNSLHQRRNQNYLLQTQVNSGPITALQILQELSKITLGIVSWIFGQRIIDADNGFSKGIFFPTLLVCFGMGIIFDFAGKQLEKKFKYNFVLNLLMRKYSFTLLYLPVSMSGKIDPAGIARFNIVMVIRGYISNNKTRLSLQQKVHLEKNIQDFKKFIQHHIGFILEAERVLQERSQFIRNDKKRTALKVSMHLTFLLLPFAIYFFNGRGSDVLLHQSGAYMALLSYHLGNYIRLNPCQINEMQCHPAQLPELNCLVNVKLLRQNCRMLGAFFKENFLLSLNNFYFRDSSLLILLYGILLRFWEQSDLSIQAVLGTPLYYSFSTIWGMEATKLAFAYTCPFLYFQEDLQFLEEEKVLELAKGLAKQQIDTLSETEIKLAYEISKEAMNQILTPQGFRGLIAAQNARHRSYRVIPREPARILKASEQGITLTSTSFGKNPIEALVTLRI